MLTGLLKRRKGFNPAAVALANKPLTAPVAGDEFSIPQSLRMTFNPRVDK